MSNKSQVDIVFINPGNRSQIYQSLSTSLSAIEPPVWAGLMATFARRRGLSVAIIDASADELTPEETARQAVDLNPVLVVVVVYGQQPSASTQVMPGASAVCTAIRQTAPQQKVLLVGGHVASLPERTLREEDADFVAAGEGLWTIVELTEALKSGESDLSKVRDLYYRDGKIIRRGLPAPLVQDLEGMMPGMAWDLLPMEKYRAHNWHCFGDLQRQPYVALYTTLGCPYHCSFCCIQAPFKSGEAVVGLKSTINSYRFWSPDRIIEEIDFLVKTYGLRNIKIADEMFVLNKKHVLGLCDQIIERGYNLNIWAYARVDTVKEDMVDKLKQAGVNWLAFGIEAASERVRDDVQKGFDQEDIYRTIRQVQKSGINVIGNYIFGLPEDDLDTMKATLDLAIDLNCEFGNFYCAMAYPGSPLYETALQAGWPLPETWSGYSQHSVDTLPLPTKYTSAAQVLAFRDAAFQKYFTNSRYIDLVNNRFGPETVKHLQEMTEHKLTRQIVPTTTIG